MHVCHFSENSLEGDYFRIIVKGLREAGAKVSLVELGKALPPAWLKDYPDVEYFNLGVSSNALIPVAAYRLIRIIKARDIDILHAHLYRPGLVSTLAKTFVSRRVIVALMRHHSSLVRMLGSRAHVALDRWMSERADRLMTVSNAAAAYMREVDGIRNPVEVVHLGFDFESSLPDPGGREATRAEFGFDDENLVIGYVGNVLPGKGHLQLLRAFAEIEADFRLVRLLLVGRGNLDEVDNEIGRLGLSNKIVLTGWRTDVPNCLAAMDIFVQPSLSEAFSQVLIEAMGAGLPTVATEVGGNAEVIDSDINGFLVPPNNDHEIAEKVRGLMMDAKLRARIGREGQDSVWRRFSHTRMVDRQLSLYRAWVAE